MILRMHLVGLYIDFKISDLFVDVSNFIIKKFGK